MPKETIDLELPLREILERLKEIEGLKYDREVGDLLQIKKSTLDQYKVRDRVPVKQLINYCKTRGVSLDWLFFGLGRPQPPTVGVGETPSVYNIRTNQDAVYAIAKDLFQALQEKDRTDLEPRRYAHMLKLMHRESLETGEAPSLEKLRMIVELTD